MKQWNRHFSQYHTLNWLMVWLLLCCSAVFFVPTERLPEIAHTWIQDLKLLFGVGILLSASYFVSQLLLICWDLLIQTSINKQKFSSLKRMVEHLDFTEKAILREFVLQRKSVINLPINEPAVKNLLDAGVLNFAYGQPLNDDLGQIKALMISLEARPLITYKSLGLSSGKMSEEQVEMIMNSRPKYISKTSSR